MPREEDIIDEGEDLDFNPEFDHLFYSAGLDDCLFEESEYCSIFTQIGDQNMWNEHSSNECDISKSLGYHPRPRQRFVTIQR